MIKFKNKYEEEKKSNSPKNNQENEIIQPR